MNQNKLKRYLYTVIFIALNAAFTSLTIKASIGVSSLDAMNLSLSSLTYIEIGTIGILFNIICLTLELLFLGKKARIKHLFQIVPCLVFGLVINFFYYHVFTFSIHNYYVALIVFILSVIGIGIVVACTILLDVTTYPLEGMCLAISAKTPLSFRLLRQSFDFIAIGIAIIITLIYHQEWTIREGTILFSLIYTQVLSFSLKHLQKYFHKISD